MKITIYRTRHCPKCSQVEEAIREARPDAILESVYVNDAAGLTRARFDLGGILETPVLLIDETLIVTPQSIFKDDVLDRKGLLQLLGTVRNG
jgi:glutaredoxin